MRHLLLFIVTSLLLASPAALAAPTAQSDYPKLDASKANPRALEANERGVALLAKGDVKGAEDEFKRAVEIDPGNLTAAYNLSGSYIVNEKREKAVKLLEEYTQKYPFDAGLWIRLGDVYFSSERVKDAIVAYEKGFALDRKYPKLTPRMGMAYALDKRMPDSERMYRLAAEESPKDVEVLGNLSSLLLGSGKVDEAITFAKRSVQVNPTSRVFVTLGSAYEVKKQPKQALAAYERAIELGDKSPEVQTKVTTLKKVTAHS